MNQRALTVCWRSGWRARRPSGDVWAKGSGGVIVHVAVAVNVNVNVYVYVYACRVSAVTVTGDTCSTAATIAGGLTSPGALAVKGSTVAFADGSGNVYACDAALALDSATPPNLYWIGSAGLAKCSSSPTACNGKPTILVPNATPTVGIAVDANDVYYLQGGVLDRVAK